MGTGGRIKALNQGRIREGGFVLYWMQAAQRGHYNHALEYAIERANELGSKVVVVFGLTDDYPGANLRHYKFMLEGLCEVRRELLERGIKFVVRRGRPWEVAVELSGEACLAVVDAGHLRFQKQWREKAAKQMTCGLWQVETNLIVPVEEVSGKEEFAARTFRPKIHKRLDEYLKPVRHHKPVTSSVNMSIEGADIDDIKGVLGRLDIDKSVGPVGSFIGGTNEAKRLLKDFIKNKLDEFAEKRNDPNADRLSNMSPYLHFGQISPVYIALKVRQAGGPSVEAYLEELVVRRELSHNFVYYNNNYDNPECLNDWSKKTLAKHAEDKRAYVYSLEELENSQTHDAYWNAAQMEMVLTGKMHGYMRMYWGKKILEWSEDIEAAFERCVYLNDKYELDGRDANGYTGVAWCFGKHDRGWAEREVFGKVRYMNANGLRRKFDADGYVSRIERLREEKVKH